MVVLLISKWCIVGGKVTKIWHVGNEEKTLFYDHDQPIFSILGDFFFSSLPKSCKISHFFHQDLKFQLKFFEKKSEYLSKKFL